MAEEQAKENLAPYLRQAHATFRNGFEENELKRIFLRNTFEEITGHEVKFCLSKSLSFCIEEMIKELDVDSTVKFFTSILGSFEEISKNSCGSHVVQTIFAKITSDVHNSETMLQAELANQLLGIVPNFCTDDDHLHKAMTDPNACHVFRSFYQMLGGILLGNSQNSDSKSDVILDKSMVSKSFTKALKGIMSSMQEIPRQKWIELMSDVYASPCIGMMVEVLNKRRFMKTLSRFCQKMLSHLSEESIVMMMKDKMTSHIFEKIYEFGSKAVKVNLSTTLMSNEKRFFELCAHPIANFVIQRLVSSTDDSDAFQSIIEFVCKGFEDILASQNYGVIQKLCEQCLKYPESQELFYNTLLDAFHCTDIKERSMFVPLLATLRTYDSFIEGNDAAKIESVEYHGSVLLQTLLNFKNIGIFVKSMTNIPTSNIVKMACDSSGSHFVDAFLTSKKVKFRNKRELVEKIAEEWCTISCDKYGSRVVEKLWDGSDIAIKRILIGFLEKNSDDLSKDEFGKYVCRKVQMKRHQTRLEEWEMIQKQICNKRKLFADIVPGTVPKKKIKR